VDVDVDADVDADVDVDVVAVVFLDDRATARVPRCKSSRTASWRRGAALALAAVWMSS
jgi:hypothetical protein